MATARTSLYKAVHSVAFFPFFFFPSHPIGVPYCASVLFFFLFFFFSFPAFFLFYFIFFFSLLTVPRIAVYRFSIAYITDFLYSTTACAKHAFFQEV